MKTTPHNNQSFTLVEMIVAMGVLSILTVLLFSVLSETSRAITMTSGRSKVYTDLRVVVDQLSRDLQQAVDDDRYNCFYGYSNEIHFVATIDNNTGNEEAEVGYFFNPTNSTLFKSVQFSRKSGVANANWEIADAEAGGGGAATWQNTPLVTDGNNYISVLDGVRSVRFTYLDTNFTVIAPPWIFNSRDHHLPSFIQTEIGMCDPQDVLRYRGAALVPNNLVRWFTNQVYLPRQE